MGLWSLESWFESRPRSQLSSLPAGIPTLPFAATFVRDARCAPVVSAAPPNISPRVRANVRIRVAALRTYGPAGARTHDAPASDEGAWVPPSRGFGIAPKKGRSVAGRLCPISATVKRDYSSQTCHRFAQPQDPLTTSARNAKCHLLLAMADFHNHVEKLDRRHLPPCATLAFAILWAPS